MEQPTTNPSPHNNEYPGCVVRGADAPEKPRSRILYLVTEDWYFCSHRLPVARAAQELGYEVVVATRVRDHGRAIENEGFRLIPLNWRRRSLNPWAEFRALCAVVAVYRRERPDLVHHVALKPAVYGSIAARLAKISATVNTVAGLGYVFASAGWKARALSSLVRTAFRWLLRNPRARVLLQNPDDQRLLEETCRPRPGQMVLIRGSGVDVKRFLPAAMPRERVVTMVSRMLWEKGIGVLAEASRILRGRGEKIRFLAVGSPDPENPGSVSAEQLESWHQAGDLEWLGHQDDIAAVWAASTIAVLPTSYGEGVPKSLLEAAACARPIVATDTAGCREIVQHGENGFLIPARDPLALAEAIMTLVRDEPLCRRMGAAGRDRVCRDFSEELVVGQTLAVYESLHTIPGGS